MRSITLTIYHVSREVTHFHIITAHRSLLIVHRLKSFVFRISYLVFRIYSIASSSAFSVSGFATIFPSGSMIKKLGVPHTFQRMAFSPS